MNAQEAAMRGDWDSFEKLLQYATTDELDAISAGRWDEVSELRHHLPSMDYGFYHGNTVIVYFDGRTSELICAIDLDGNEIKDFDLDRFSIA